MSVDGLRLSVEQYRLILEHARQLEGLLSQGDAAQIERYVVDLNHLQEMACQHDGELMQALQRDRDQWQRHQLFRQREQLMQEILEINALILPRVHGMMSVLSSELEQLQQGKVAMAGYRPASSRERKQARGIG